jgi:fibronectin type 3 domain-containing protein
MLSTAVFISAAPGEVEASASIVRTETGWGVEVVDAEGNTGFRSSSAIDVYGRTHIAYRNDDDASLRYATNSGGDWKITIVDTGISLDSTISLALDGQGKVHIAYMSYYGEWDEHLVYATNRGGDWTKEAADPDQGTGYYNDLFIDQDGYAHLAYYDYDADSLKYANNTAGSWTNATVDANGCREVSLAVNSYDVVHILYAQHGTNDVLRWAQWSGGSWFRSTLDSGGGTNSMGRYNSMALYGQELHLTYFDDTANELLYQHFDGVAWMTGPEVVDGTGNAGEYSSVAVGSDGIPHIAYYDTINRDLRAASRLDGGWDLTMVDDNGANLVGEYCSIAVAPNGMLAISYQDGYSNDLLYASYNAWIIEKLAGGTGNRCFGNTDIELDDDNNAYISYTADTEYDLMFATNAGGAWTYTRIDNTTGGSGTTSIELDADGKVHIAYYASDAGEIRYATNAGGSWSWEKVADTRPTWGPNDLSLGLDSNGKAHIAYSFFEDSGISASLRYATNAGGTWVILTVDGHATADTGRYPSLVVDASNKVHICYKNSTSGTLRYATNAGGAWALSGIDASGNVGDHASMTIDHTGRLHISYMDNGNKDLKYAFSTGGVWVPATVDAVGWVGEDNSIGVDQAGKVHISYFDSDNDDLKYATNVGGSWAIVVLDHKGITGMDTGLAIGTDGMVHISYYDGTSKLGYATNSPWKFTTVQDLGYAPNSEDAMALAIDSYGAHHVCYYDRSITGLRYATDAGGSWSTTIVEEEGAVGQYCDIAVDSDRKAHISYYDAANQDLRYSTNAGGSWAAVKVDGTGLVGTFASIAVDVNGKAHISYRDSTGMGLKYATNAGGSWVNETVDDTGNGGSYSSICLDEGGKVHISYYGGSNSELKYANNVGGSWDFESVDNPTNAVGLHTSIVATGPTDVHISYWDMTAGDLKYATFQGTVWNKETVDASADITGLYTSLVMDGSGRLHMSYWDQTTGDLRYALKGGAGWSTTSIDLKGDIGRLSSLAIDGQGALSVFYLDYTDGKVKLAAQRAEPSAPRSINLVADGSQVSASWPVPTDLNGYPVLGYILQRISPEGIVEKAYQGSAPGFTDTGLPGGTYSYRVAAYNLIGIGPFSVEGQVAVAPSTAPTAPTGLGATPGNGNVSLIWYSPSSDGGSTVLGFKVYRGTTSGGETLLTFVNSSMNYLDLTVTNGQPYFYKVSAFNSVGEGPLSNEVTATPSAEATVPGAPTGLYAFRGDQSMSLEWSAPTNNGGSPITGYNVYRGNASGDLDLLVSLGNVTSYAEQGLVNGHTYFYAVSAVNSVGEGPLSNEANATPASYPSAPRNLTAALDGDDVVLTWERPEDDGGFATLNYSVFRGNVSGSLTRLVDLGDVLTYTDMDIDLGVTYFYHVKAMNGLGESDASNEVSSNPDIPTSPTLSAEVDGTTVALTWTAPADQGSSAILHYRVYRGLDSGFLEQIAEAGNVLNYTDDTVSAGYTYLYQVTAVNSQGEGPRSNQVSVSVGAVPSAPQGLEAEAGDGTVTLTWEAPSDDGGWPVTGYKVYRGTAEGAEVLLATLGNVTTYTDSAVANDQTYHYRVSAVNAMGEGASTGSVDATPSAEDTNDDDGGGNSTMLYIIIAIVAMAGVAAVAAFFFLRKR